MDKNARETGRSILKEVIGDEYFERRENSTNSFNRDLRQLAEAYCFGEVWSRPGLDRKTRSLLCLVMLTALGKSTELRAHLGGALRNGCTTDEIKEALLQTCIYCGLPASIESYRIAEEVLREAGRL